MNKGKTTEQQPTAPENPERSEPMATDELLAHVFQDVAAGVSGETLVEEFFEEFVNKSRDEETKQVLTLLDMPDEMIINALVDLQMQGIALLQQNAPAFLQDVRARVKARFADMAK